MRSLVTCPVKRLLIGIVCYTLSSQAFCSEEKISFPIQTTPKHDFWLAADSSPTAKKPYPYGPKAKTPPPKKEEDSCDGWPHSFRVSFKHREANGIGYDTGYTSADVFFAFSSIGNVRPFFDIRLHVANNGHPAANLGFGVRFLPEGIHAVFGANIFFDFRQANHSTFEQLGAGFEILGTKWDFHLNSYVPIISTDHVYSVSFRDFQDHKAIFRANRELALNGLDMIVGRMLVQKGIYDLNIALGSYYFFGHFDTQAIGGLVRLRSHVTPFLTFEVQGSYDSLYKAIAQGEVAFNIPFGKRVKVKKDGLSCSQRQILSSRYVEPVDRFEMIVSHIHHSSVAAIDPRTNHNLHIVFVDNTSSGGSGTAQNPYATLLEAQNNSSPYDMIYVFAGDGTTKGMNAGLALKNYQWLQGSGNKFAVKTKFGPNTVPAQTKGMPTISTSVGDTIVLGHGNTITGCNIYGAANCISGNMIDGLTATYNSLGNATESDFELINVSGKIVLQHNTSSSPTGLYLDTPYNVDALIEHNVFANWGEDNVFMSFSTESVSSAHFLSNAFLNSQNGTFLGAGDFSTATYVLKNNTFTYISPSATSVLDLTAENSAHMTAVLENNSFSSQALSIFTVTADNSLGDLFILNNSAYNTNPSPGYSVLNFVKDTSTTNLLLSGNIAGGSGYLLDNGGSSSTFNVQSKTGDITWLEAVNSGAINTTGSINFVSYDPDSVPNTSIP